MNDNFFIAYRIRMMRAGNKGESSIIIMGIRFDGNKTQSPSYLPSLYIHTIDRALNKLTRIAEEKSNLNTTFQNT